MKCEMCGNNIGKSFMEKIIGTYVKDQAGKKHAVCFECQKKASNDKKKILESIK
jgi:hypothetical protein